VTVTTIHGAKGKEWDMVFVIGCEEGILPSAQSIKASQLFLPETMNAIEEERRLLFVAMTRARHTLILSWARERTAYYKTQTPSRFLSECKL
jgi:DNA helicase-2/ATP-dependent DNA helicase PcrA